MKQQIVNPHDRFFKQVLSRREAANDFLRHYLPAKVVKYLFTGCKVIPVTRAEMIV